jgi:hypothetical protein
MALALIDLDVRDCPDALTLPSYSVACLLLALARAVGSDIGELAASALLGGSGCSSCTSSCTSPTRPAWASAT